MDGKVRADPDAVIGSGDFYTSPYCALYARVAGVLKDVQAEGGNWRGAYQAKCRADWRAAVAAGAVAH